MALKVYKFEQPDQSIETVYPFVEEIDKPAKGVLTGLAIMIPFYMIIGAVIALFKRF